MIVFLDFAMCLLCVCESGAFLQPALVQFRWECRFFEPKRQEIDPDLAAVPRKYFATCIRCGIAPAMKMEGERTYWGMNVDPVNLTKPRD